MFMNVQLEICTCVTNFCILVKDGLISNVVPKTGGVFFTRINEESEYVIRFGVTSVV